MGVHRAWLPVERYLLHDQYNTYIKEVWYIVYYDRGRSEAGPWQLLLHSPWSKNPLILQTSTLIRTSPQGD